MQPPMTGARPPAECLPNSTLKCLRSIADSEWAHELPVKRKTMHYVEEGWCPFPPFFSLDASLMTHKTV